MIASLITMYGALIYLDEESSSLVILSTFGLIVFVNVSFFSLLIFAFVDSYKDKFRFLRSISTVMKYVAFYNTKDPENKPKRKIRGKRKKNRNNEQSVRLNEIVKEGPTYKKSFKNLKELSCKSIGKVSQGKYSQASQKDIELIEEFSPPKRNMK